LAIFRSLGRRTAWIAGLLAVIAAPASGLPDHGTLLADLSPEVEQALEASSSDAPLPGDARALLERVIRAAPAYRFGDARLIAYTDRRWYSTLPAEDPASPMLVVRRWPGDTVAAFYALAGGLDPLTAAAPALAGSFELAESGEGWRRFEGTLKTALADHPALWVERSVPEVSTARLGALLLPGDAGLGIAARDELREELLAVLDRIELDPAAWGSNPTIPAGAELRVPRLDLPPLDGDERADPWQIARGRDFTLGLPPGVRSKQVDFGIGPPRPVEGGLLWIRGRFVDRNAKQVVIGGPRRAGYVAELPTAAEGWSAGRTVPLGMPAGERVSSEPFDTVLDWTRAKAARAEKWREPGWDGEWMVFRLVFDRRGVEIGLPIAAGFDSLALFWIPCTWREADQAPAAPPIDPARRFDIRFEALSGADRRTHPLAQGFLVVPGLRMEIPRGWAPVVSLRSRDGFPIKLWNDEGVAVGALHFLPDGTRSIDPGTEPWVAERRPKAYGATEVRHREDGTWVYVSPAGPAFMLQPLTEGGPLPGAWGRMARTVLLNRSKR
jgi:hypothetical protein